LKLEPKHLMKMAILKDIDRETISKTLDAIKFQINPELLNQDLQNLLQQQDNPLTDQINAIMKGLD